ncbi:hypothetical protein [Bradyrhizobium sp.]|jgi:hypothetical protein|uniref:hypothetical protein n=1 Tax=Bradyrhizobium sp. TaxID=376 RepID=UPI002E01630C|nr:hypothetical protein [Bradyrhizobium sp.]
MPKITEGTVALGGLFAVAIWFLVGLPLYYGPPHSSEQKHITAEQPAHGTNTKPDGSAAAPFVVQVMPSPKSAEQRAEETEEREEKKSADRWLVRWTAALFAATVGLILATGVLGYFGLQQSRDMKHSVAAATAAVEVANKAFVAEHRTWLKVYPTAAGPVAIKGGQIRVTVTIEAQNIGQNPAIAVNLHCKVFRSRSLVVGAVEMAETVSFAKGWARFGSKGFDLLPGEKTNVTFTMDAGTVPRLEEKTKEQIAQGLPEMPVIIVAAFCVIYKSVVSDEWRHSSHLLWIGKANHGEFDLSGEELSPSELRCTVIPGESSFA